MEQDMKNPTKRMSCKGNINCWVGYENDSPTQLLDRFARRFPDTTESDIRIFAKAVGIGETVVNQYLFCNTKERNSLTKGEEC